jgi:hypothetical protein
MLIKKTILLLGLSCLFFSCDFILKPGDENSKNAAPEVVTGTDKDKDNMGCVISAGYRWSQLKKNCIRPVEEGYRLNSIEMEEGESTYKSAFITFDPDKKQAELFLPDVRSSEILKMEKEGVYKSGKWVLNVSRDYQLLKGGVTQYVGAKVQEGQVTGSDKLEE